MNDRPLFSLRYGHRGRSGEHFGWRHCVTEHEGCELNPRRQCICPSAVPRRPQCCAGATQEDRLCDECREHCYAVDAAGVKHRAVDLYPVRAVRS